MLTGEKKGEKLRQDGFQPGFPIGSDLRGRNETLNVQDDRVYCSSAIMI